MTIYYVYHTYPAYSIYLLCSLHLLHLHYYLPLRDGTKSKYMFEKYSMIFNKLQVNNDPEKASSSDGQTHSLDVFLPLLKVSLRPSDV